MRLRVLQFISSGVFSLVLAGALRIHAAPVAVPAATPSAAAVDTSADSPFLPSNTSPASAVTDNAPIELHGIMSMPDGMRFSIYDPTKKSATWVRLNERGTPFLVHDYKVVDGADQVKIDYQGSTLTLGLKAAKITAMAAPVPGAPGPIGGPMGRGGNAITNSVVVNPTPADEAARLQAVVEAVAARRAARNQATQQQAAGGVPVQTVAPAAATAQPGVRQRQRQPQQQQP